MIWSTKLRKLIICAWRVEVVRFQRTDEVVVLVRKGSKDVILIEKCCVEYLLLWRILDIDAKWR